MTVNFISESEYFAKDHGVHTAYLTMAQMVRDQGEKVLVNSLGKSDITHVQTMGPFSLYKLKTANRAVVSAHLIQKSFIGSIKGAGYWMNMSKSYLLYFYNQADLVLAVSPNVKDELITMGVKKRIEVFPNPVNSHFFRKNVNYREEGRKLLGLKKNAFVFVGVGQLQPRKGIADFIKLARRTPSGIFVWIGSKPFKSLTASDSKMLSELRSPPSNFFVKGPFSYKQMPEIYNSADVFLFPSYQENAPMGVIEASSCGLPLILRDNPEYKVLYQNNYIACGSMAEFEKKISYLMNNKEGYRKQVQKSKKLAQEFSSDKLGDRLIKLYNSLK